MKYLAWVVAVFAMIAGSIKVYNELEMTKQYARWADASVRQAEALEALAWFNRYGTAVAVPRISFPARVADEALWTTCAPGVTGRIEDCTQIQKNLGIYPWTGRPN